MIKSRISFSKKEAAKWLLKAMAVLLAAVAVSKLLDATRSLGMPKLEKNAGFGLLFLFGLLTSIHCVGMCGGLMLTQCVKKKEDGASQPGAGEVFIPPALYNAGRIVSYTVIGGIVGGIGQALSLSGFVKGLIPIVGGGFMVVLALNLLGVFPFLRRLQFGTPKFLVKKLRSGGYGPFILGMLTGIMPCGPLQMAQVYALTTRSAMYGALSMLLFSAGTVPCLFAFGSLSSLMTKRFSKVVMQVSAVLIIILGISMIRRGVSMSGILQMLKMKAEQPSPMHSMSLSVFQ